MLSKDKTTRNHGIDLLKVIAILTIIIFHSAHSLSLQPNAPDYSISSNSVQQFGISVLLCFGVMGNNLFFICSAWYFLQSDSFNKRKVFRMICEIWFISIFILVCALAFKSSKIQGQNIISFIFPTTFANNWYLTCYLLFYAIHPHLNSIIQRANRKMLFRISLALSVLYFMINFFIYGHFYVSQLIIWITMYFVVAYARLYHRSFCSNAKLNTIGLLIGVLGHVGLMMMTNSLGLRIGFLNNMLLHWNSYTSPFMFITAFSLLNLFREVGMRKQSGGGTTPYRSVIAYLSGLSMYIYLIHENLILRRYRSDMFQYLFSKYGMDSQLLYVLVVALIVTAASVIASSIYYFVCRKYIIKLSDMVYSKLSKAYRQIEKIEVK